MLQLFFVLFQWVCTHFRGAVREETSPQQLPGARPVLGAGLCSGCVYEDLLGTWKILGGALKVARP